MIPRLVTPSPLSVRRPRLRQQPLAVGRAGVLGAQGQDLRHLVGVQLAQAGGELVIKAGAGFDHEQHLRRRLHRALPAVDGLDAGHQAGARCQALLHERGGGFAGMDGIRKRGEDEQQIGHAADYRSFSRMQSGAGMA